MTEPSLETTSLLQQPSIVYTHGSILDHTCHDPIGKTIRFELTKYTEHKVRLEILSKHPSIIFRLYQRHRTIKPTHGWIWDFGYDSIATLEVEDGKHWRPVIWFEPFYQFRVKFDLV